MQEYFNKGAVEFSSLSCHITADKQLAEKMHKITKEYANRCNLYKEVKTQWQQAQWRTQAITTLDILP